MIACLHLVAGRIIRCQACLVVLHRVACSFMLCLFYGSASCRSLARMVLHLVACSFSLELASFAWVGRRRIVCLDLVPAHA